MINNRNTNYLFIIFLLLRLNVNSQEGIYIQMNSITNSDSLKYRLLLPDNYDEHKKYPVTLFFEGLGSIDVDFILNSRKKNKSALKHSHSHNHDH